VGKQETRARSIRIEDLRIRAFDSFDGLEPAWRTLETEGHAYAFQAWSWVTAWQAEVGARAGISPCPVLVESAEGEPLLILPLGTRRSGRLTRLEWLGGDLSDYHGPLLRELPGALQSPDGFRSLWQRILRELPPFDLVHFERQPETIGTLRNPFLSLECSLHPCRAHSTGVSGTLDEFLASKRSTSWRRKERRKERRLADHGEVQFIIASTPEEIDELLPEMMRQKSRSYHDLGANDLFAVPGYREFLTRLTRDHVDDGFVFLCALRVGEVLEATYWGVVRGTRFYHLLPTYAVDELTRYAPGNLLLRHMFQWCLDNGIEVFDFTSGDDEYKTPWCDQSMALYDYFEGITRRGKTRQAVVRIKRGIKKRVKRSPKLLELARWIRARLGTRPA
jgi:CelD/BcsL family acetyltransferase involved in cellulose biosynthesis